MLCCRCLFEKIEGNLAHIQPQNLQNVQKCVFGQNGLKHNYIFVLPAFLRLCCHVRAADRLWVLCANAVFLYRFTLILSVCCQLALHLMTCEMIRRLDINILLSSAEERKWTRFYSLVVFRLVVLFIHLFSVQVTSCFNCDWFAVTNQSKYKRGKINASDEWRIVLVLHVLGGEKAFVIGWFVLRWMKRKTNRLYSFTHSHQASATYGAHEVIHPRLGGSHF